MCKKLYKIITLFSRVLDTRGIRSILNTYYFFTTNIMWFDDDDKGGCCGCGGSC